MRLLVTLCLLASFSSFALDMTFDDLAKGEALKGWEQGFYGAKGSPLWIVDQESTAPSKPHVLKQTGNAVYSWLAKKDVSMKDGVVEADMKVISGKEDPEVGLVWRHRDGKNYYYMRINAVEDNVVFYRMNNGKKELVKEADTKVGNDWHHIKVQFKGDQIEIFFDKKPVISVRDAILKDAGKVGFFTTADTVGAFDNFKVK